ncbi:MAG: CoA pyrophosphatase [Myxococcales bacterium]|nr:CoA pyrophosphatase [Myxococcales bacterium]
MNTRTLQLATIERRLARQQSLELDPGRRLKHASVAVILRSVGDDIESLFIRRRENPRDRWSGQMAFPGGKADPEDPSLEATARRETLEEVAIDLSASARLIGKLDDLQAIARGQLLPLVISPFVYLLSDAVEPTPREDEVDAAIWVSLSKMFSGDLNAVYYHEYRGVNLSFPSYKVGERYVIWGLTYQMLQGFFTLLTR